MRVFFSVVFLLCGLVRAAVAAEVVADLPSAIDPEKRYLFYLHGVSVELQGPDSYNKQFGKTYQTTAIAQALSERGFVVVAELRPKGATIPPYARKLADQIQRLIAAGVPPSHIAVMGHSKGGLIGMWARMLVPQPDVSFVLMAACPLPDTHNIAGNDTRAFFERFMADNAARLRGRLLSLYDVSDGWMGSCGELFTANPETRAQEIALKTGLPAGMGHSLFFSPDSAWVSPAIRWITER